MRPVLLLLLPLLVCGAAGSAQAEPSATGPFVVLRADEDYETVRDNLEAAITDRGLLVTKVLHLRQMLDRTGLDLGYTGKTFSRAETLEFCSADMAHRMVRADPRNLTICPFTILVYALREAPDQVYIAYRRPVLTERSAHVQRRVEQFLAGIAREALE